MCLQEAVLSHFAGVAGPTAGRRPVRALLGVLVAVVWFLLASGLAEAQALRPSAATAIAEMEADAGVRLEVTVSATTGLATFVSDPQGQGIPLLGIDALARAEDRALLFMKRYGAAFGIADESQIVIRRVSRGDELGFDHVRLRQMHRGVPVTVGEILVHLRGNSVVAANGETLPDLGAIHTEPTVTADEALVTVRDRLGKHLGIDDAVLDEPRLEILSRGLLESGRFPTRLAWYVEARGPDLRERFWIDAETGAKLLRFSQLAHGLSRSIYDAASGSTLPGTLVRGEGGGATGDPDVDDAYDYSGDTYGYFWNEHGRDSYDDAGAALVSTVDFCPQPSSCPYANAYWNGSQMVYGDGFPAADDVVAHELTHAVTEYTADLYYYQQSGALNESFSDIFGETVDLTNSSGTDTAGVRWQMGEDVPGLGAIRDMMDPTIFGDPGKMSDPELVCGTPGSDRGGVHSNSGIPNHAYALMVDGGFYNGYTVTGIGLSKAGKIEYRVLSQYLLSGSDFLDAANAIQQSCTDLIGTAGITAADCVEVGKAVEAVEMRSTWCGSPHQSGVPGPCPFGSPLSSAFFDDLEAGGGNWSVVTVSGTGAWWLQNMFATSGTRHIWGENLSHVNDSSVFMSSGVTVPANGFVHFNHSFGFEELGATCYDGGVLEYSTNGSTWNDASSLISAGATYSGTIESGWGNPLAGRSGFCSDSFGYTASRLDLQGLAGQSFQIRFRVGSDSLGNDFGWFLDDVGIYECPADSYPLSVTRAGSGSGTVTSSPAGVDCGADCSETYAYGTVVTLAATPDGTSTFAGWSGAGCSGTGTCAVTMTAAKSVTATFTASQSSLFTDIGAGLPGVEGAVAWGDYDNDEDLDILLASYGSSRVYRNDGGGVFTEIVVGLTGLGNASVAWGDYDDDGDLDILMAGESSGTPVSRVYRNDGGGVFTDIVAGLTGIEWGSVAWGDYDNDGDLDILQAGNISGPGLPCVSQVYRNDGGGVFTDIAAGLTPVFNASVAWGDYDNDGDLDILLTGNSTSISDFVSQVYRNDGGGVFTDVVAGLPGIGSGSVAWGDYDNDGDLDILLTGNDFYGLSKVYRNDGGVFTDVVAGLTGVLVSSVAWGDYDNDGDLDILLTGLSLSGRVARVYRNDGGEAFTDVEAGLSAVQESSVAWGDYDKDGDLDILLTGNSDSGNVTRVYRNDNTSANALPGAPGSLVSLVEPTEVTLSWGAASDAETPAAGLSYNLRVGSSPGGTDVVSPQATPSGYRKIPATGNAQPGTTAFLRSLPPDTYYWSVQAVDTAFAGSAFAAEATFSVCGYSIDPTSHGVGSGGTTSTVTVTAVPGCSWTAVSNSAWITVTSGASGTGNGSVGYSVAANPGPARTGTLTVAGETFTVDQSSGCTHAIDPTSASYDLSGGSGSVSVTAGGGCAWTAVSNDAWITVTSGANGSGNGSVGYSVAANTGPARTGTLTVAGMTFTVTQTGTTFTDIGAGLTGVHGGSVAWGDYDNDGDLDILLTGMISGSSNVAKVYRNDDDGGAFTDVGAGLTAVTNGSVAWGDYDNDGDLDILLTGYGYNGSSNYTAEVYRNDGGGVFTDVEAGLTGVSSSSAAWGDYDNDGDLDILLTGDPNGSSSLAAVYRNDGGDAFTDIVAGLTGVYYSSVAWGDYDDDGDLDILLTGRTTGSNRTSKVYRNDGGGVFTDIEAGLTGVGQSSAAWGDYDNDGDLDILIAGRSDSNWVSLVYRNDGNATFVDIGAGLSGINNGSVAWGDYDNDGDLDILLAGTVSSSVSEVYRNDGGDVFTVIVAGLPDFTGPSSVAWGDYDNDGDLDILLAGLIGPWSDIAAIYRNDTATANTTPGAPSSLAATTGANDVSLSWVAASDAETPAAGLTYNLRVGTSPGAGDVVSPMAAGNGYRRIPALGNAQHGTTAAVTTPTAPGTYYWSVQAVDTAFAGSAFAGEETFTVCGYSIDPTGQSFASAGGGGSIAVTAPPGCAWTAVSHEPWITVTSGASGSGSGVVGYSVAANTGPARTGTLTVAGQTFTVNQSRSCTYTIDPTSASFDPTVGAGDVSVTAPPECAWTAVSHDAWIVVESGSSGSGNGNVGYLVMANTGAARTGTLTIAGHTLTVTQAGLFTEIGAQLMAVSWGSVAWGDYDDDGDLDVLLTGTSDSGHVAIVYRNDGGGAFTDVGAQLAGVFRSSVAWGDYDNDGDLDILLAGETATALVSKVYRNDGAGIFTDIAAGLPGVTGGAVAWGDYDNDGDLDILLTGRVVDYVVKVYRNDGGDTFTDIEAGLSGAANNGSVAWGDYDGDGDLDILLAGLSKVYRNDGGGVFTDIAAGLTGVYASSVAWGDFNNDGNLDILLTGYSDSGRVSIVYRNDGGGTFTDINAGLTAVGDSSVAWGDYDNDGYLDILLAGWRTGGTYVTEVYHNDGGSAFTNIGAPLAGVRWGSVAWGDYDDDGDLDALVTGDDGASHTAIYRNDGGTTNTPPGAPASLSAAVNGGQVELSWSAANDSVTHPDGLTYNLRVGTSPGAGDVVSPMAAGNGYRRIPALGNAQHGTTAAVTTPAPGTYYWSVQAVDTAFAGSAFAGEETFTVCGYSIDPTGQSFASAGGGSSVAVTAPPGCAWTAVSHEPWITVTSGATGSGNGSVGYSVAANTGPARTGTLTVAGHTFTVTQAGLLPPLIFMDGFESGDTSAWK